MISNHNILNQFKYNDQGYNFKKTTCHICNSDANTYGKKGTIQICSGPEGLRSLHLTLRKRSHYPCYATSPKFQHVIPLMLITHQKIQKHTDKSQMESI